MQRAQSLERLLAELGKLARLRKAVASQVDQTQRQRIVVPPDECSGAVHERLRPTVREKREGPRPLIRGEHLNTLAIRLPVARPLVVHPLNEVLSRINRYGTTAGDVLPSVSNDPTEPAGSCCS